MGFSIAGAGHVAAGMADMEGQLAQNKFRHQLNEQMASQVRQQQEREAFERMARRNIQAPQWNLGNLPQGQMQNQPSAAPAAPEQVSARNENYGNEGRSRPAPSELERLQAERAQYAKLYEGAKGTVYSENQRQLAGGVVKPLAAAADVVTAPIHGGAMLLEKGVNAAGKLANSVMGRKVVRDDYDTFAKRGITSYYDKYARQEGYESAEPPEAAGYKQGIAQYDELINAQRGKDAKAAHAKVKSSTGCSHKTTAKKAGKKASKKAAKVASHVASAPKKVSKKKASKKAGKKAGKKKGAKKASKKSGKKSSKKG